MWSPFSASKGPDGAPAVPQQQGIQPAAQQQQEPKTKAAAIPTGRPAPAHPQHHEGATDATLFTTFSLSDVGLWSWNPANEDSKSGGGNSSMWGRFFGKPS